MYYFNLFYVSQGFRYGHTYCVCICGSWDRHLKEIFRITRGERKLTTFFLTIVCIILGEFVFRSIETIGFDGQIRYERSCDGLDATRGIANRDNVLRPLDEHLSSDKCFVIKIQLNEIISIKDNVERRSRLIYWRACRMPNEDHTFEPHFHIVWTIHYFILCIGMIMRLIPLNFYSFFFFSLSLFYFLFKFRTTRRRARVKHFYTIFRIY